MTSKRIIKLITAAVMLAAVIALMASCGSGNRYKKLDKDGYTVSVTFDPSGGTVKGTQSTITDVFSLDDYSVGSDGKISIPLLSPDDPKRDPNNPLSVTKIDHFLAGWYTERTPINANDPSKGYTYSGKWDFEKDTLSLDPDGDYTSAESQLTLYAAWIPYYNFEIYSVDDSGKTKLLSEQKAINLTVPSWSENSPTIEMGNFPKRDGYTLEAVYLDKNCETLVESSSVSGQYNEKTGVQTVSTVKLYTKWIKGEHYRIYNVKDLRKYAKADASYEIMADLDFEGTSWPAALKGAKFTGTINGNGHTFKNISISTTSSDKSNGLFEELRAGAVIKDVVFENLTHTINVGRVAQDATFGLLAGYVAEGATFENVTVSGKLIIGDDCKNLKGSTFTIGLICGSGTPEGVSFDNVVCEKANKNNTKFDIVLDDNDEVTLVFAG